MVTGQYTGSLQAIAIHLRVLLAILAANIKHYGGIGFISMFRLENCLCGGNKSDRTFLQLIHLLYAYTGSIYLEIPIQHMAQGCYVKHTRI